MHCSGALQQRTILRYRRHSDTARGRCRTVLDSSNRHVRALCSSTFTEHSEHTLRTTSTTHDEGTGNRTQTHQHQHAPEKQTSNSISTRSGMAKKRLRAPGFGECSPHISDRHPEDSADMQSIITDAPAAGHQQLYRGHAGEQRLMTIIGLIISDSIIGRRRSEHRADRLICIAASPCHQCHPPVSSYYDRGKEGFSHGGRWGREETKTEVSGESSLRGAEGNQRKVNSPPRELPTSALSE